MRQEQSARLSAPAAELAAPAIPARLLPTAQHSQQLSPSHNPRAPQRMTQSAPSSPTHRSFALRNASTAVNKLTNSNSTPNSNSTESNGNNSHAGSPSKLLIFSRIPTPSSLLSYFQHPSPQQAALIPSTSPLSPSSPMPSPSKHVLPSSPYKPTACTYPCASACSAHRAAPAFHSPPFKSSKLGVVGASNHAKHPRNDRHSFPSTLGRMAVLVFLLLVSNYLGHVRPVLWSSSGNRGRLLGAGPLDWELHWKLGLGGRQGHRDLEKDNEIHAPREWEILPEEPQLTFVPEKEDQVSGTVMIRGRALQKH